MSLNLGNVVEDCNLMSRSIDDVYMEWLEAYHDVTSVENALEIMLQAKATASVECMQFAEELLGISLEKIDKIYHQQARKDIRSLRTAFTATKRFIKEIERLQNKWKNDQNTTISINIVVWASAERGTEPRPHYVKNKSNSYTEVSVSSALNAIKTALNKWVIYYFGTRRPGVKDNLQSAHNHAEGLSENKPNKEKWFGDPNFKDDREERKLNRQLVSILLSEARRIIKYANTHSPSINFSWGYKKPTEPDRVKTRQRQGPYPDHVKVAVRSDGSTVEFRHNRNPW